VVLVSGSETNGRTIIEFNRKLNTKDKYDVVIEPNKAAAVLFGLSKTEPQNGNYAQLSSHSFKGSIYIADFWLHSTSTPATNTSDLPVVVAQPVNNASTIPLNSTVLTNSTMVENFTHISNITFGQIFNSTQQNITQSNHTTGEAAPQQPQQPAKPQQPAQHNGAHNYHSLGSHQLSQLYIFALMFICVALVITSLIGSSGGLKSDGGSETHV